MSIEIERLSADRLERQLWEFHMSVSCFDEINIKLTGYVEQERKTMRHKFIGKINRIYKGRLCQGTTLEREDIPLTEDVIDEIKSVIKAEIDSAEIS